MCFFLSGKIPSPNKNECILNAEKDSRDKEINISPRIYTEYAFRSCVCVCVRARVCVCVCVEKEGDLTHM